MIALSDADPRGSLGPVINGRRYPLWSQFVARKSDWIGGILVEDSDGIVSRTTIKDIQLVPNDKESALFRIVGEAFTEECDVRYLSVAVSREEKPGWISFDTSFGTTFKIRTKEHA